MATRRELKKLVDKAFKEDEKKQQEEIKVLPLAERTKEEKKKAISKSKEPIVWDVKIGEPIDYFDPLLSYELTGYRPINETQGLDFDPEPFMATGKVYETTGNYTTYLKGSKLYNDFWQREFDRCVNGYTVNGYTLTGDNYFFLNYFRLQAAKSKEKGQSTLEESFPSFYAQQYTWFHYYRMCELLGKDACALKPRGCGWSQIAASMGANLYTCVPQSSCIYAAALESHLTPTIQKIWDELEFLNSETNKGMLHLSKIKNSEFQRRASYKVKEGNVELVKGSKSEIRGVIIDNPRKMRGSRVNRLFYEEAGSNPNLVQAFIQGDPLVTVGGQRIGTLAAWGCVCAGSQVYTRKGDIINIEQLQQSDGILGFSNGHSSLENITYMQDLAYKECVNLETRYGNLRCSVDHPILVQDVVDGQLQYVFKEAATLKPGDVIIYHNGIDQWGSYAVEDPYNLLYRKQEQLPGWYQTISRQDAVELLAGLYDSIGVFSNRIGSSIVLPLHDEVLFNQVQFLLNKLGIYSVRQQYNTKGLVDPNIYVVEIDDIQCIINFFKNIPVRKLKNKRCLDALIQNQSLDLNGIKVSISNVTPIGVQRIYNLTADNTHTYIANNIVTHNTGGDSGPQLAGLDKMFHNPEVFNILPFKNNYNQKGETVYTAFFIPAYTVVSQFLDNRGVCDTYQAKKFYEEKRKNKASDPDALMKYKSEFCFYPEEALIREGENRFDSERLSEQLTNIELHKLYDPPIVGKLSFVFDRENNVPDYTKSPQFSVDNQGKIKIVEYPIRDSNNVAYRDLYVIGCDSIDQGTDQSSGQTDVSDFCVVVYRRTLGLQEPKIVALYKDRPKDIRTAYDNVIKLAKWYNCQIVLEATRVTLITYLKEKGLTNLLMKRPRATLPNQNVRRVTQFGVTASTQNIEHQLDLIDMYINDYCQNIQIPEVLDELIRYSFVNKRKFDIVAAFGMALLGDEELQGKAPKVINDSNNSTWQDIGYYWQNGQKKYGIIPKNYDQESLGERQSRDDWVRTPNL